MNNTSKIAFTKQDIPNFPNKNIWKMIFSYLNLQEVAKCMQVCKLFCSCMPDGMLTMKKVQEEAIAHGFDYQKKPLIEKIKLFFQRSESIGRIKMILFLRNKENIFLHKCNPEIYSKYAEEKEGMDIEFVIANRGGEESWEEGECNYLDLNRIYEKYVKTELISYDQEKQCLTYKGPLLTSKTPWSTDIVSTSDRGVFNEDQTRYLTNIRLNKYEDSDFIFSFSEIKELIISLYKKGK